MGPVDIKLLAMLNACHASISLVQQLPEVDIVLEIEEILKTQMEIGLYMLNDAEYGIEKLDKFIEKTQQIIENVSKKEKL